MCVLFLFSLWAKPLVGAFPGRRLYLFVGANVTASICGLSPCSIAREHGILHRRRILGWDKQAKRPKTERGGGGGGDAADDNDDDDADDDDDDDVSLPVPETLTCDVVLSCPRVRFSGAERAARASL